MKNLILIIALSLVFVSCKKKEVIEPDQEVYCCFIKESNGNKYFYKCVPTKELVAACSTDVSNKGIGSLFFQKKLNCGECNPDQFK